MPTNTPPAARRGKNFDPREAAAKKKSRFGRLDSNAGPARPARASRDDRPVRDDRPARADRPARDDRAPRVDRADRAPRNEFAFRDGRPVREGRHVDAKSKFDRPVRTTRDERRDDRPARDSRPVRDDRPARDDRAPRNDRFARDSRPVRDDRPARDDRRPARDDRPSRDDRAPRTDRFSRDTRPARNDRPVRDDRRPARDDRAPRNDRFARDERPARRDSDFYPSRDEKTFYEPGDDIVLDRLQAMATTAEDVDGVTFGDLGLGRNIETALLELGAIAPFPIQAATIPDVLAGRDVLGRGRTGSGKTIAFGAPLVELLMANGGGKKRSQGRGPRALILAPTRELAMQINRTVMPIAKSVGLFTMTIVGGVPQGSQVMSLRRGVDIVIATPGRLEDLARQRHIDLSQIQITVLDEADHMCDLGFLEPVQRILRDTAEGGQRLLFSATLDKGVAAIIDEFLPEPAIHEVAGEDQSSSMIDHRVFIIDHRDKIPLIEHLVRRDGKTLVFTRTRAYAEQLADELEDAGIPATSLHGDLNQSRRTRNLERLTTGRVNVLVATDVAARGIHVDDIDLVIQADAPDEYKTYLHRSGRTGRAGKTGTVVTLIPKQRQRRMTDLLNRAEIQAVMVPTRLGDPHLDNLV
jgi:superfamily II DNA/RNA helicase